jgi:hypothetical protein
MESMKNIVVSIGARHRVVIDELNHTLQAERQTEKKGWKTLGYYPDFSYIVKRLAKVSELEAGEYEALEYANSVLDKAFELCEELKGRSLK